MIKQGLVMILFFSYLFVRSALQALLNTKVGKKKWKAFVPGLSRYVDFSIAGKKGWGIVSIVGIVLFWCSYYAVFIMAMFQGTRRLSASVIREMDMYTSWLYMLASAGMIMMVCARVAYGIGMMSRLDLPKPVLNLAGFIAVPTITKAVLLKQGKISLHVPREAKYSRVLRNLFVPVGKTKWKEMR